MKNTRKFQLTPFILFALTAGLSNCGSDAKLSQDKQEVVTHLESLIKSNETLLKEGNQFTFAQDSVIQGQKDCEVKEHTNIKILLVLKDSLVYQADRRYEKKTSTDKSCTDTINFYNEADNVPFLVLSDREEERVSKFNSEVLIQGLKTGKMTFQDQSISISISKITKDNLNFILKGSIDNLPERTTHVSRKLLPLEFSNIRSKMHSFTRKTFNIKNAVLEAVKKNYEAESVIYLEEESHAIFGQSEFEAGPIDSKKLLQEVINHHQFDILLD